MSPAPQPFTQPRPPRVPPPRLRIVVADDDADLADTIALLLSLDGHEVHCADDGHQALDLVRRVRPQVALLDIGMPLLCGYSVAHAIRAMPWGEAVRLVALSGETAPGTRERVAQAGFDRHLTKPVTALELLGCLATLTQDDADAEPPALGLAG